MSRSTTPIRELIDESLIPLDFLTGAEGPLAPLFDHLYYTDYLTTVGAESLSFAVELAVDGELALGLPGLDGFAFVLGSDAIGGTRFTLSASVGPRGARFTLGDISLGLRFPPSILKPAPGPDAPAFAQIDVRGDLVLDENFDLNIEGFDALALPRSMIGDSGIIVSAQDVKLDLSRTSTLPEVLEAGFDESFLGVFIGEAVVEFPSSFPALAPDDLVLRKCAIGSGGVSGRMEAHYNPTWDPATQTFSGHGGGALFGVPFGLRDLAVELKQNSFVESTVAGRLLLPYFDELVEVEIGLQLDGGLAVKLTGDASGLVTFTRPGLFSVQVDSLEFDVTGSKFVTKLSGLLTPLAGGLAWPSFRVNALEIDSEGNVHLEGGWLDLKNQYALDFHGFHLELTKLGFGKSDDGGKWLGFSGGLQLVHGLSAGASVEGLRIVYYNDGRSPRITLDGVGVELTVPKVLHFQGKIAYREADHRFVGAIKLELMALKMSIDATLVVGKAEGETYLGIYLDAELPAGIPLFATGLSLYGLSGLFALQMEPDRHPDEAWYDGYYKRAPVGVTDLDTKWIHRPGSLAFGAGVTIGTSADNGHAFSGKLLLVIVFPGPIILLEGKANLLKKRAALDTGDPNFRALAVLDNRAGTFLVGLDAQYKKGDQGQLIDIHAGAEAFFSLHDSSAWHLYLGQRDPREKRIRAQVFHLFEADAYFMLDRHQLALGASIGFIKKWKFGPLEVKATASIEGASVLSWNPSQLHGELRLQGEAGLSVWGFGASLSVDASLVADVFEPFHIVGDFKVGIGLPWPLPDFDVDISVEWGPEPIPPPIAVALKEIAVEHLLVTSSWPLPRSPSSSVLVPADDRGDGNYPDDPLPIADLAAPPPPAAPVVPLDARPHLTFGRPVNDDALVGVNAQAPSPEWERIGDPALQEGPLTVRYAVSEVALHRWVSGAWQLVARKAATANPGGEPTIFGSWAPTPGLGSAQAGNVKLWLWSKTPFDATRHSGTAWDESFAEQFSGYPCLPPLSNRMICCILDREPEGVPLYSPWHCLESPEISFAWTEPRVQSIVTVDPPIAELKHALCFAPPPGEKAVTVWIELPQSTLGAIVVARGDQRVSGVGYLRDGTTVSFTGGTPTQPQMAVQGDLARLALRSSGNLCIAAVCALVGLNSQEVKRREEMAQHLRDETARWSQVGEILQPHTQYRLSVVTSVAARGEAELSGYSRNANQTALAYFQTQGPPGLSVLSTPIGATDPFDSGLTNLNAYVAGTVPATLLVPGERPALQRPVYRGYDVGVSFNQDYVDLMYRLEGRDLGLYLFDASNQPVREADGRLAILANRWGHAESLTLSESELRWVATVNAAGCAQIDTTTIPRNPKVSAVPPVRAPDTVYEARLVPLLLHDDFSGPAVGAAAGPGGTLGPWTVVDEGPTLGGPSHWEVRLEGTPATRSVVQTTGIRGGTVDGRDPVKPGTLLLLTGPATLPATHPDRPANWTDYRLSVQLRASDGDALGVVFRYLDAGHFYRFSFDRNRRYRRLVRVVGGRHSILAEDDFVFHLEQDYLITLEALGSSLRIYQDGEAVFEVVDPALGVGTVGLYCWANPGARFADVRIDDFRSTAPVVYRFQFTTSRFVDFFHHLHSGDDRVWLQAGDGGAALAQAVSPTEPQSDPEARAFETVAAAVFGSTPQVSGQRIQITALQSAGATHALWVDAAEPIDWRRTALLLERAAPRHPLVAPPNEFKLTDVTWGTDRPNQESVTLLLREAANLSGARLEWRHLPAALAEPTASPLLWEARFADAAGGLLFSESYGPNALDHYRIVDQGSLQGPSQWSVGVGGLLQSRNIYGGTVARDELDKPGTLALTGEPTWRNIHLETTLRSDDDDAIGVVFRYQDDQHYYRFSMDRERTYRRLVKRVAGVTTLLWEDSVAFVLGQSYALVIDAFGGLLIGRLNGALLFTLTDEEIQQGQVGLYCWANTAARFPALEVRELVQSPLLWQRGFEGLDELDVADGAGAIDAPSLWSVDLQGALVQTRAIRSEPPSPADRGTVAFAGDEQWRDIELQVRLRSDAEGAIGVVLRARGESYYRFSMDRRGTGARRLVRLLGGTAVTLWESVGQVPPPFEVGRTYQLTLRAVGTILSAALDGVELFSISDSVLPTGRIGFFCSANPGARFEQAVVLDRTERVGPWEICDQTALGEPSRWKMAGGLLSQHSSIGNGDPLTLLGSLALAGQADWTDVRLRVVLRSDDAGALGVVFRYVDPDNHYRLSLDAARTVRRLLKRQGGVTTVLWVQGIGFPLGQPMEITIDAVGPRLVGFLDGTRLFEIQDAAHATGKIGLYCSGDPGARFEAVRVERPGLLARALFRDRFLVADRSAWTFLDEGTLSGPSVWSLSAGGLRQTTDIYSPPIDRDTLDKRGALALAGDPNWTDIILNIQLQALDDDALGVVFRYAGANDFYRFSMDSQRGYRRLVKCVGGVFTRLWEATAGFAVGQAYRLTVVALGSSLRAWLNDVPLFSVDDPGPSSGRIGLYTWGNKDALFSDVAVFSATEAFADWLLEETFDLAIPGRWQFLDAGGSSAWSIANGELSQQQGGGDPNHAAATLALSTVPAGGEFRLEVELIAPATGSAGVVFGYLDAQNHYRVEFGTGRRLVRVAEGTAQILWQDTGALPAGRMGLLTIDALAGEVRVFLDGELLVHQESVGGLAGRIGLSSALVPGARFGSVRLEEPQWALYHEFDRDRTLPAGTRLRLHAGNPLEPIVEEAGVTARFVTTLEEAGRLRLPQSGAELRLRRGSHAGHQRRFLPDSAYTSLAPLVLRKADGTAFWLASTSPLAAGEYRLRLTFRRDNRPLDPLVLSESGIESPEEVVLDCSLPRASEG